jgi:uncharacterized DUF497 family protein
MNWKKALPYIALALLAIIAVAIKRCNQAEPKAKQTVTDVTKPTNRTTPKPVFDRQNGELFFSKHAKCRMQCRKISQAEVKDILANGTVNYNKSDLTNEQHPKYAVEGRTKDRQYVRIIFAPKQQHITVVTVIDLDKEWPCPICD